MKKILLLLTLIMLTWTGYEATLIWSRVSTGGETIGRWVLQDRHGTTITELPRSYGLSIPYTGSLDTRLIESIVAIEDRRFYEHHGIDIIGKLGAIRENYRAGDIVRGGSTITEQYVKLAFFGGEARTLPQKIEESLYALIMELRYTKGEILQKYLDTVYMGNGIYGIATAEKYYFDGRLDDAAIIEIITRIKYPNLTTGALPYMSLVASRLSITDIPTTLERRERPEYIDRFPLFTERIEKELSRYCSGQENRLIDFVMTLPRDICETSDIILRTSIDAELTSRGEAILEATLSPLEAKNVHNGSILIWSEKEKKILVYIANRKNGRENAIDMIAKKRSVGSVLKPFIYSLALERGADIDDYILDETSIYETADATRRYVPENYIPKSYGPITLAEALGNSLNSATVRLSEHLGIGRIYDLYRRLGFDMEHDAGYYGYGISLGAVELSLENVLSGYRTLTDMTESSHFLIYDVLRDSANRARTFGISSILNTSIPLAVKTGTSTDFRDNWTIGYNPDIIIGVWVGNTDNSSMDDVSGVTGAGPIYHAVAEELIRMGYIERLTDTPPSGVVYDSICLDSGCLQKRSLYKKSGTRNTSEPKAGIYYESDFVTPLTSEERVKWKIR